MQLYIPDLYRNYRCYHCHKGTGPSIKDAIIHIGQKHPEKDVIVLKRQLIDQQQKYKTFNFNVSAKDITNIEDVVVDENLMILSMINTRQLASSSLFGKLQKHEINEECGTPQNIYFQNKMKQLLKSKQNLRKLQKK